MNKLFVVARSLVMITFLTLMCAAQLWAHITVRSEKAYEPSYPSFSEQDIRNRLDNMSSVIDINYTYEVGRRIKDYTVNYRRSGENILGKVDLYFPLFEKEIHERQLPEELKYVAVVESHLEPSATSHTGAAGLWQFMRPTGRMKGLKINSVVDERRDPVKSTRAALDYLHDLYCEFDDWTLAIAAYNCGPGNVRKAIRRGGSYNFWDIRRYLPRETQDYVPRIIAAMYLMQYYHIHNLTPRMVDRDIKYTTSISDGKSHNLYKLSQKLDIPYKTMRLLNPQYRQGYIPKNDGDYTLVIPRSRYEDYLKAYDPMAYHELIKKRRAKRLMRLEEIREIMAHEKLPPISNIEFISPKVIQSEVVMQESVSIQL
jgi:membrane-bound lytic murein transglycosylase D